MRLDATYLEAPFHPVGYNLLQPVVHAPNQLVSIRSPRTDPALWCAYACTTIQCTTLKNGGAVAWRQANGLWAVQFATAQTRRNKLNSDGCASTVMVTHAILAAAAPTIPDSSVDG